MATSRKSALTVRQCEIHGCVVEHTALALQLKTRYYDTVVVSAGQLMASGVRNNASTTRGRPFSLGNSGRPKGSRNKTTLAMEALLDGEAELITRKAVEMAKAGDTTAIQLCLDRLLPPRKDRAVAFALPKLESAKDAVAASAAILAAVANGDLTPGEAGELSKLVANYVEALKTSELEERLSRIEARTNQ